MVRHLWHASIVRACRKALSAAYSWNYWWRTTRLSPSSTSIARPVGAPRQVRLFQLRRQILVRPSQAGAGFAPSTRQLDQSYAVHVMEEAENTNQRHDLIIGPDAQAH